MEGWTDLDTTHTEAPDEALGGQGHQRRNKGRPSRQRVNIWEEGQWRVSGKKGFGTQQNSGGQAMKPKDKESSR